MYAGDEPDSVLEAIIDGDTPSITGSFSASGRQNRIRSKLRGRQLGIHFSNATAAKTFILDKIVGDISLAGKVK